MREQSLRRNWMVPSEKPFRIPVARKGFFVWSNMEREKSHRYSIEEMQVSDIEEATKMRLESWLDTYPNVEAGVTREWVEARSKEQISEEKNRDRVERFIHGKENGVVNGWVAKMITGGLLARQRRGLTKRYAACGFIVRIKRISRLRCES